MNGTIRPLGDRVLVEREQAPDHIGNIILPESARHVSQRGYVRAIGPHCNKSGTCINIREDTKILFGKYAGVEVEDDDNFLLLKEEEILAVIE